MKNSRKKKNQDFTGNGLDGFPRSRKILTGLLSNSDSGASRDKERIFGKVGGRGPMKRVGYRDVTKIKIRSRTVQSSGVHVTIRFNVAKSVSLRKLDFEKLDSNDSTYMDSGYYF